MYTKQKGNKTNKNMKEDGRGSPPLGATSTNHSVSIKPFNQSYKNSSGDTASFLHYLVLRSKPELVEMLLSQVAGCNIHQQKILSPATTFLLWSLTERKLPRKRMHPYDQDFLLNQGLTH